MKRAQVGVEALIAIGIVFLILLTTYTIYTGKERELRASSEAMKDYNDCLRISDAITNAYSLGENSHVTTRIYNTLTIYPTSQRIEGIHAMCTIPVAALANTSTQTLTPGTITITNTRAGVEINA